MIARTAIVLFLSALLSMIGNASFLAYADGGVSCNVYTSTGVCDVSVGSPGSSSGISKPSARKASTPAARLSSCRDKTGAEIACTTAYGTWDGSRDCYVQPADPQPELTSPVWLGRTDGVIMRCIRASAMTDASFFWRASAEVSEAPDPFVLAQRAVERMELSAITVGSVPKTTDDYPKAVGVVSWNVWLWVKRPSERDYGPITRSVSVDGYTVTATARVTKVVWDMGNGDTVTCGKGTSFPDGATFHNQPSPTCGYVYYKDGRYRISATSYWEVEWSGIGRSGTISMQLTASGNLAIAEIQVLNVPTR